MSSVVFSCDNASPTFWESLVLTAPSSMRRSPLTSTVVTIGRVSAKAALTMATNRKILRHARAIVFLFMTSLPLSFYFLVFIRFCFRLVLSIPQYIYALHQRYTLQKYAAGRSEEHTS